MKIFVILLGLFTFSLTANESFAGGCGSDTAHSHDDTAKKKQGSEI